MTIEITGIRGMPATAPGATVTTRGAKASSHDSARARVSSEAGSVEGVVEVSAGIVRGVVSLPHGWGHDRPGARMSVARERARVNGNLLAPGHLIDVPSGNAAVNGIPVEVTPALVGFE